MPVNAPLSTNPPSAEEAVESGRPTRARILEAATALFADHGFDNVSLRQITQLAEVNLAAVNYHFGGKDNLVAEVVAAHMDPISCQRLELLKAAENAAGAGAVPLKAIVSAFLSPMFTLFEGEKHATCLKLLGRCMSHDDLPLGQRSLDLFREITRRYPAAVSRTLPDIPVEVIQWRLLFSVGSIVQALLKADLLHLMTDGTSRRLAPEEVMQQAVDFCTSGLGASWEPS